jgi:hypothetical protein
LASDVPSAVDFSILLVMLLIAEQFWQMKLLLPPLHVRFIFSPQYLTCPVDKRSSIYYDSNRRKDGKLNDASRQKCQGVRNVRK